MSEVAYYRFEGLGNIGIDSSGNGNTLTNSGAGVYSDLKWEGDYSALFTSTGQYLYRTDANLTSDFPGKSSNNNLAFSCCAWFACSSQPATMHICGKYNTATSARTWRLTVYSNGVVAFQIGINGGANYDIAYHATSIQTYTAYIAFISLGSDGRSYRIRLYDANGDPLGTDVTGQFNAAMSPDDAEFRIGYQADGSAQFFGVIDFVKIFDEALTPAQMDTVVGYSSVVTNLSASCSSGFTTNAPNFTTGEDTDLVWLVDSDYTLLDNDVLLIDLIITSVAIHSDTGFTTNVPYFSIDKTLIAQCEASFKTSDKAVFRLVWFVEANCSASFKAQAESDFVFEVMPNIFTVGSSLEKEVPFKSIENGGVSKTLVFGTELKTLEET